MGDEGIRDALVAAGVSADGADAVVRAVLPAVVLTPHDEPPVDGGSRVGGAPDLPPDLPWPHRPAYPDGAERAAAYLGELEDPKRWWREQAREVQEEIAQDLRTRAERVARPAALSLVAQVDLAAVAAAGETLPDLPSSGRLLLFYDLVEQPWGFDPAQHGGFLVLHDDSPSGDLERREPPDELAALGADGVLPQVGVALAPTSTAPVPEDPDLVAVLSDEDAEAYREWWYAGMDDDAFDTHRVGGHPSQVQGDMRLECAMVSAGHSTGDTTAYDDHAVREPAALEAPEWVLVLQVASDDDRGVMWGDSGFLYVWMRRADLRERAFGRAVVLLQCF